MSTAPLFGSGGFPPAPGEGKSGSVMGRVQGLAHDRLVPLNVSLELTLGCNLRCHHCYNGDRDTNSNFDRSLGREEVLALLPALREAGCLFLTLSGGEVFLYPHLFDVLDRARELSLAVQLLSNGTLLRPGVAARLARYRNLLGVSVSLYGSTPEVHDGLTQVQGSWRRTWEGVKRMRALGIAVRLKFVVVRSNAHEVGAMRAAAEKERLPYLVDLTITSRHDGTAGSLRVRATDDQLASLIQGPLADLVPSGRGEVTEERFACNCARGNCAIAANGDVYPCLSVPWTAGNVRTQTFAEIWASSPVFQQIRGLKMADYPSCAPCGDKVYCSRNRGAAFNGSGSYTGVDPFVCQTAALVRKLRVGT